MIIDINQHSVHVRRNSGERVKNEANFWYHLQRQLNAQADGDRWVRVRPHKWAMTSMPFALRLGPDRNRNNFVLDNDYAIRCPAKAYNSHAVVLLKRANLYAKHLGDA